MVVLEFCCRPTGSHHWECRMLNFFKNAEFDGGDLHFTASHFGTPLGQASFSSKT
jgi:hypothetical protein